MTYDDSYRAVRASGVYSLVQDRASCMIPRVRTYTLYLRIAGHSRTTEAPYGIQGTQCVHATLGDESE